MGYSHDECLFTHPCMRGAVIGIPNPEFELQIIKQNSPRIVVGMDGTHGFGSVVECVCWWRGVNFYFYHLGTATNVFSMEGIGNFWS